MVTLSRPNLIWYQRSTTECLVWVKSMEGPCKYWQNTHFVTIKICKAVLLTIRDGSVITKLCAAVARYPQRESSKILNVSHRWRKNPLFKRLLDRWEKESVNFDLENFTAVDAGESEALFDNLGIDSTKAMVYKSRLQI